MRKHPFNKVMRERRLALGLSQVQLGKALGMRSESIYNIEASNYNKIAEVHIRKVANFLNMEVSQMFPDLDKSEKNHSEESKHEWMQRYKQFDLSNMESINSTEVENLEYTDEETIEKIDQELLKNTVSEILGNFNNKTAKILGMRFGLGEYNEPMTLRQIADHFSVTPGRIRQVEIKMLNRIRTNKKYIEILGEFL